MNEELADLDPFDIFDAEAARIDRFLAGLDAAAWAAPSRCAGWSVRDVLAHLAGEEMYNHACLDGDLDGLRTRLEREGITELAELNEQTFHYSSEYATHADDMGVPVGPAEEPARTRWRAAVARFVPAEQDAPVRVEGNVEGDADGFVVSVDGDRAELYGRDLVEATVGRLPGDHPLSARLRTSLRCLA